MRGIIGIPVFSPLIATFLEHRLRINLLLTHLIRIDVYFPAHKTVNMFRVSAWVCARMKVCVNVYVCTYLFVYKYIIMYVHYICVWIYMHVHYICLWIYMYVHVYVCGNMYVHIHVLEYICMCISYVFVSTYMYVHTICISVNVYSMYVHIMCQYQYKYMFMSNYWCVLLSDNIFICLYLSVCMIF